MIIGWLSSRPGIRLTNHANTGVIPSGGSAAAKPAVAEWRQTIQRSAIRISGRFPDRSTSDQRTGLASGQVVRRVVQQRGQ